MSGVSIAVETQSNTVMETLKRLLAAAEDLSQPLNKIGDDFEARVDQCFADSRDPYGNAWEELKVRDGQPLIDTSRLRNSYSHSVGPLSLRLGTNVEYAAVHQFGHTFTRYAQSRLNYFKVDMQTGKSRFAKRSKANFAQWSEVGEHGVTIPARPFFPDKRLPPDWERSALDALTEHLQAAL